MTAKVMHFSFKPMKNGRRKNLFSLNYITIV